jgi:hypothetical protein
MTTNTAGTNSRGPQGTNVFTLTPVAGSASGPAGDGFVAMLALPTIAERSSPWGR